MTRTTGELVDALAGIELTTDEASAKRINVACTSTSSRPYRGCER
jgi:hypothetical protein